MLNYLHVFYVRLELFRYKYENFNFGNKSGLCKSELLQCLITVNQ